MKAEVKSSIRNGKEKKPLTNQYPFEYQPASKQFSFLPLLPLFQPQAEVSELGFAVQFRVFKCSLDELFLFHDECE